MNEKEDQGCDQLTNAEVYLVLSLTLMEMRNINLKLDELLQGDVTTKEK